MTLPKVTQTEIDGALGVLPATAGPLLAVVGTSSAGTAGLPSTFARVADLVAAFGQGPLVESAARMIGSLGDVGRPVLVVKAAATTAGALGTIDSSHVLGTLTGFITADAGSHPFDDYEVMVVIVAPGTTGVAGITYQYSLDGGRTLSPVQALGTSLTLTIPNSGVIFDLTTGKTALAGDFWTAPTTAPLPSSTDVTTALTALAGSAVTWEIVHVASPIDGAAFDAIELAFAGSPFNDHMWIGNTRIPNSGESEAAYLTAMTAIFGTRATVYGDLDYGAAWITSSVSAHRYLRAISFADAPWEQQHNPEVDVAQFTLGPLPGVSLRDDSGNPIPRVHDERLNPGADDARFTTLTTDPDFPGVYVGRPRLFSSPGSDFFIVPMRRVMNLVRVATRRALKLRLSHPVLVDPSTGFILETEAKEIEAILQAAIKNVLGDGPKASGWTTTVRRNTNILATRKVQVDVRIVPLAYVETIEETLGFTNPAAGV